MSLLQYGPMQGDARLAELTLERLVKTHKMSQKVKDSLSLMGLVNY